MKIYMFLSYPKPHLARQTASIDDLIAYLRSRGFEPRTLGVTTMIWMFR